MAKNDQTAAHIMERLLVFGPQLRPLWDAMEARPYRLLTDPRFPSRSSGPARCVVSAGGELLACPDYESPLDGTSARAPSAPFPRGYAGGAASAQQSRAGETPTPCASSLIMCLYFFTFSLIISFNHDAGGYRAGR